MPTGVVKWFDVHKHFGFIVPDEGGPDVFVHVSALGGKGSTPLKEGQGIEFDLTQSLNGPQAINIRRRPDRDAIKPRAKAQADGAYD